jgi:hypothetical protein
MCIIIIIFTSIIFILCVVYILFINI